VTTIADTTRPGPNGDGNLGGFSERPSINSAGTVALTAQSGVFSKYVMTGTGGSLTTIANNVGGGSGNFNSGANVTAINDSGTVAFRGTTPDPNDFARIWTGGGGPLTAVFNPVGPPFANGFGQGGVSVNASGNVAFHAFLDAGGEGIFLGNGGTATTVADSSGPFSSFFTDAAVNDADTVAFIGFLDAGGYGIFTGPDPVANKIVAIGDPLFGSTVNALNIGNFAINDLGQVAFFYNLTDGRNGLAIATPVPEPSSLALVAGGVAAAAAVRRRRAGAGR
jgi:hypothetical protein